MKVAIDISPLKGGHRVRGVGFYLQNLKDALIKYFPQNDYFFFDKASSIPDEFRVVHFPYFDPFFLTLPFLSNKKIIVTVHDLIPIIFKEHFPAGLKGSMKWQIQKRKLKRANAIITDSESSKKDIEKILGVRSENVHTVYLAASSDFKELKNVTAEAGSRLKDISGKNLKLKIKKFGLPDQFLLYVGDVAWNKNLPRIVQTIKETSYTLVMVGKTLRSEDVDIENPWNKDLALIQKETEGDPRFIKLGFISSFDLNLLYNMACALVMPSIDEGFGLPILEAMQAGCPVITSKEGSIPEVAGQAALYVDAYDTESIKAGIIELVKDEKLQKELSKKGRERSKLFSWKKTAGETLKVYDEVVRKS